MTSVSVNEGAAVTQKDTEGSTAARLIAAFNSLPDKRQTQLLHPKQFQEWARTALQLKLDHPARILTVLRHQGFHQLFYRFCCTRYGEKKFSWHTSNNIIASRLDCVSFLFSVMTAI